MASGHNQHGHNASLLAAFGHPEMMAVLLAQQQQQGHHMHQAHMAQQQHQLEEDTEETRGVSRGGGGGRTRSGDSRSSSAYASRHQQAEARRRNRINERWSCFLTLLHCCCIALCSLLCCFSATVIRPLWVCPGPGACCSTELKLSAARAPAHEPHGLPLYMPPHTRPVASIRECKLHFAALPSSLLLPSAAASPPLFLAGWMRCVAWCRMLSVPTQQTSWRKSSSTYSTCSHATPTSSA